MDVRLRPSKSQSGEGYRTRKHFYGRTGPEKLTNSRVRKLPEQANLINSGKIETEQGGSENARLE